MKAILFDLDNTLLIKRPTIPEKWHAELCRAGYSVALRDAQRAFAECEMWVGAQIRRENETGVRLSDDDFLRGVTLCGVQSLGVGESASGIIADVWLGKYDKRCEMAEGAADVLESLRKMGLMLGIVSNNSSGIRKTLTELGLMEYFSAVVISEEVNLFKPDPRILLHACEKLGVAPEDAVYVGDHPFDVVCANEANVRSAWIPISEFMRIPEGAKAPDFRLEKLSDIKKILQK